jgi:putative membrane protein
MYTRRDIRPSLIFRFAWKNLVFFTVWAALITAAYVFLRPYGLDLRLPFLPLSTIGIAVAFYLGFKNSQSYDRFWEGRKLWGGIVNLSRTWATQVRSYVADPDNYATADLHARHQELIYRQLAWINTLRLQLRRTTIHDRVNVNSMPVLDTAGASTAEPQVSQFLSAEEYRKVSANANAASQLLHHQGQQLQQLYAEGLLTELRQIDMMVTLKELYGLQGGCERIKNTPFPRQYAYFSTIFVRILVLLLPFGLIGEFSKLGEADGPFVWLTVPFSILISWIFTTIEIVGDSSEDPFENYVNDVPMTALCRTIEIDLREMLRETELPARIQPINDILL